MMIIILVQTISLAGLGVICWLLFEHIKVIHKRIASLSANSVRATERIDQLEERIWRGFSNLDYRYVDKSQ